MKPTPHTGSNMSRLLPLVFLFAAPFASAQDAGTTTEHPVIAEVRSQLGKRDPAKPFMLLVTLKAKQGMRNDLMKAVSTCKVETRKEAGNKRYQLLAVPTEPLLFQLSEQWMTLDDLARHMETPHLKTLLEAFDRILDGPPGLKVFVPAGKGK